MQNRIWDSILTYFTSWKGTSGAGWVLERGVVGGGRNESDTSNNLTVIKREANRSVISAGTGAKTIGTASLPLYLMGININAPLIGTLTITGFTAEDGTTAASIVLPIGFSGSYGANVDARCEAGCTVQKSSASDDAKISVDWRPIN